MIKKYNQYIKENHLDPFGEENWDDEIVPGLYMIKILKTNSFILSDEMGNFVEDLDQIHMFHEGSVKIIRIDRIIDDEVVYRFNNGKKIVRGKMNKNNFEIINEIL